MLDGEIYQIVEYKYKPQKQTGFFTRVYKALDKGWKGLLSFIVALLHIWPVIILIATGWYIYIRYEKKKNNLK